MSSQGMAVVVGPGRVGSALARSFRTQGATTLLIGREGPRTAWNALQQPSGSEVVESLFFAVPDDALTEVVQGWAQEWRSLGMPGPRLVAHCCGLRGPGILDPWTDLTACRASLHPVTTFPDPQADPSAQPLQGIPVVVEAEGQVELAAACVAAWGAQFIPYQGGADRRRYHLGLTLAANHVTALLARGEELLGEAVGEAARELTIGLAGAALAASAAVGPAAALTGPVVRGDRATLKAHLDALPVEAAGRHRVALLDVLDLAVASGRLAPGLAAELRAWLEMEGN